MTWFYKKKIASIDIETHTRKLEVKMLIFSKSNEEGGGKDACLWQASIMRMAEVKMLISNQKIEEGGSKNTYT